MGYPDHLCQAIPRAHISTACPVFPLSSHIIKGWFVSFFDKPAQVSGIFADKEPRKNQNPPCFIS
jgi:hypothetical protein